MRKVKRFFFVPVFTAITVIAVSGNISTIETFYKTKDDNNNAENEIAASKFAIYPDTAILPGAIKKSTSDTTTFPDSLYHNDTTNSPKVDTFSIKISKDSFDAPVEYAAQDSVVGLIQEKIIILHGKAKADYQDVSLTAPVIELDQDKNVLKATASKDSIGDISEYAEMKQGGEQYKTEGLEYNFKTQRGLTRGAITQQGEMYVHTDIAKKVDSNTMYAKGTYFTTCNLDRPHFGFRANKAKIINRKIAVTGAVRPEFDSVPMPIALPFGYFPLYQGRRSGLLPPNFETNDQEGLGLSGLGYYKILGPYMDMEMRGDIYSLGTWKVYLNSKYLRNYRYNGGFNLSYTRTNRNFKGDLDHSISKNYSITLNHAIDTRARPGVNFGANINYSTTRNNQTYLNDYNQRFQNQMGSSINFSKTWIDKPFNLNASATHNQNNSTHIVNINLPNLNFTMSTIYPLQKKESVGSKKWYEQLGIGYQGSFQNNMSFVDTINYKKLYGRTTFQHLWDTLEWRANHSIPISLSLPPILGGAVTVSPSVSYSMDWVDRKTIIEWDETRDTIKHRIERGFNVRQRTSFGLSFNTALYGQYRFKNSRVTAIRHVVRPTIGMNYTPDMTKSEWRYVQIDPSGTQALYSVFESASGYINTKVNQFMSKRNGSINFSLDNNVEMKVRNKKNSKDTTASEPGNDFKKVRLIEGFGLNTSYNFFATSMKLSPISMYFRTNLFEKINFSAGATLMPYKLNDAGYATKNYAWEGGKLSLGKITNANISLSTSFQSKPKDPQKEKKRQEAINEALNDPMLRAQQQQLLDYMRTNPSEFVDFNTQWSVNISFSFSYNRGGYDVKKLKWQNNFTAGTSLSGSFNLTPKWNFSVSSVNYDFITKKLQSMSFAIARDLHCWQLGINVGPIGPTRFFNFTISPKAGILQDLKINRTRSFY